MEARGFLVGGCRHEKKEERESSVSQCDASQQATGEAIHHCACGWGQRGRVGGLGKPDLVEVDAMRPKRKEAGSGCGRKWEGLRLPGSGCKGSWVCTPRCSWPTRPSGGEPGGGGGVAENHQIIVTTRFWKPGLFSFSFLRRFARSDKEQSDSHNSHGSDRNTHMYSCRTEVEYIVMETGGELWRAN